MESNRFCEDNPKSFSIDEPDAGFLIEAPLKTPEIIAIHNQFKKRYKLERKVSLLGILISLLFSGLVFSFTDVANGTVALIFICLMVFSFVFSSFLLGKIYPISITIDGITLVDCHMDVLVAKKGIDYPSDDFASIRLTESAKSYIDIVKRQGRSLTVFETRVLYESARYLRENKSDFFG